MPPFVRNWRTGTPRNGSFTPLSGNSKTRTCKPPFVSGSSRAGEQAAGAAAGRYQPGTGCHGAQELDPNGTEGWRASYLIRSMFAEGTDKAVDRANQYRMAASNLAELVKLDPTEPRLRLLLAETLFKTHYKDDDAEGKKQLQEALRLDTEAGDGPRSLSEEQRAKLSILLGNVSK